MTAENACRCRACAGSVLLNMVLSAPPPRIDGRSDHTGKPPRKYGSRLRSGTARVPHVVGGLQFSRAGTRRHRRKRAGKKRLPSTATSHDAAALTTAELEKGCLAHGRAALPAFLRVFDGTFRPKRLFSVLSAC